MNRGPLVWIDMLNSPNVLFCRPLIDELERRGYRATVTVRDFAQTVAMCRLYNVPHTVIGEHGGATLGGKGVNLAHRVWQLSRYAAAVRPDVALTHNSYSQLPVTRLLGIPSVTSMDYEHQPANHLAFRCANWVFVPRAFPDDALHRLGAPVSKVWKYPGIKEDVALAGFVPNPGYRAVIGVGGEQPLVVVRPPARFALYHRFENPLFADLMEKLRALQPNGHVLVLPRTDEQRADLAATGYGSMVWNGPTLKGPELIAAADAVITAGGSMAREAAALGTPAFSVYAGKMAAIDLELEREGRLTIMRSRKDLEGFRMERKSATGASRMGTKLVPEFIDHVEQAWRWTARGRSALRG